MKKLFILLLTLAVFAVQNCCGNDRSATAVNFKVRNIYGDHMVLQQQKPIKIAGTAEPGKSVKAAIGKNSVIAAADKDGNWVAVLPAMKASFTPYTITVSGAAGSQPVTFKDVLIGEVWFCSGQSNMQMPVVGGKFWCSKNGPAEAAAANYPNIRIFQVALRVSPGKELDNLPGNPKWEVCTPKTIGKFSACGFYFGRKLHKDLNVPIGLINSSWGGSRIEPWISKEGYFSRNLPLEMDCITAAENTKNKDTYKQLNQKVNGDVKVWLDRMFAMHQDETGKARDWKQPGVDTSSWQKIRLPSYGVAGLGAYWFVREIDLPQSMKGKDLILAPGVLNDLDETFFNGKMVGSTGLDTPQHEKHVRSYKVPGHLVKAGKNTIAIRLINIRSIGTVTGKMSITDGREKINLAGNWFLKEEFIADPEKTGECPTVPNHRYSLFPATLYNAMVHAWTVYPVRGVIWYQGCSNAGFAKEYLIRHKLLIRDWRNRWNDADMPFIFTQLAAFYIHSPKKPLTMEYLKSLPPEDKGFPKLREVQAATLSIPNTGMAVTIDIGDHSDFHPADKQTAAFRLAMEAKRLVYGYKGITSGARFKSMKINGNKVIVTFTGTGSGLQVKGDQLNGFSLAGKDGRFIWAKAKLLNSNTVEVWADGIKDPTAVRYAWAPYPIDPNLYNKEGFPTCPFRSDTPDYLTAE